MRIAFSLIMTVIVSGIFECSSAQIRDSTISILTDSTFYAYNGYVTRVLFTIHNGSDSTIYFDQCCELFDYYVDRMENQMWTTVRGIGCPAICLTGTMALFVDSSYSAYAMITTPGKYRLVLPCGKDSTCRDSLISAEFTISDNMTSRVVAGSGIEPSTYWLAPPFPNPFNPTTQIRFSVPLKSHVILDLVDVLGRRIATILDQSREPGVYQIAFSSSSLASGTYFLTMTAGQFKQSRELIHAK